MMGIKRRGQPAIARRGDQVSVDVLRGLAVLVTFCIHCGLDYFRDLAAIFGVTEAPGAEQRVLEFSCSEVRDFCLEVWGSICGSVVSHSKTASKNPHTQQKVHALVLALVTGLAFSHCARSEKNRPESSETLQRTINADWESHD